MSDSVAAAIESSNEILGELEELLRGLSDADLHRAHPDGGHTIAQVVSHIHLAGLASLATAERMRYRPSRQHVYREEIGHDAVGAPPPTAEEAADRIASLRVAVAEGFAGLPEEILGKEVEIPPLGTIPLEGWTMIFVGHFGQHAEQVRDILRARGINH